MFPKNAYIICQLILDPIYIISLKCQERVVHIKDMCIKLTRVGYYFILLLYIII